MAAKVTNCKVVISCQLKVCLNSQPSKKASEASASGGLFRHRRQYPGSQPCAKEAEIDIIARD
jgi:hypothetical protein